ncbi:MAG: Hsp20/alpha crystallin family protein [Bacteroidia bacterium]|nr:Hsp20/alpha crystallin family protein [Bacteroidia bacterium]MCZ2247884.1 Hsp20/alpha crystallin family protein [Bacteroidia bacterium]
MALIKFQNPSTKRFFETDSLFPKFGNAFDNFLKMDYNFGESTPLVNVTENEQSYQMEYLVPGYKKDEIKISLDKNVLTVIAEKRVETEEEKKNYTRKEFFFNTFKRSFSLPENINYQNIEAKHEDGILNITIPKKVEEKNSNVIEIDIK